MDRIRYSHLFAVAAFLTAGPLSRVTFAQNANAPASGPAAQNLPLWAYPVAAGGGRGAGGAPGGPGAGTPGQGPGGGAAGAPGAQGQGAAMGQGGPGGGQGAQGGANAGRGPAPPSDDTPKHVPGSSATYTASYIRDLFNVPDWFPEGHPPMPEVVSQGRKPTVRACGYCHLPNGQGRPENESVAGLPAEYIIQQFADFKNGLRKSSEPRMGSVNLMIQIAKAATDDEVKAAAAYFSSFKLKPWIRVVETETVPQTKPSGGMLVVNGDAKEPIGQRIIEVPEDLDRTELRDPTSGFIAYVPSGSIKRGEVLVTTGGNGKTIPCTICHGADLRGIAAVPSIAGRSPSQMVRQIIDIQTGARDGPYTQLMKEPVAKLTNDDIVAIGAYLASRTP